MEKAVSFIKTAADDPIEWKWGILSVHGALYGFMICVLKGTDWHNVCTETTTGQLKLIDFREALSRCQKSDSMNISGFTHVLRLTGKQKQDVKRIHDEFRNQFLHYRPTCWNIEVTGMPEIIGNCLDVLRAVALEMGSYYAHYNREHVAKLVAQAKGLL